MLMYGGGENDEIDILQTVTYPSLTLLGRIASDSINTKWQTLHTVPAQHL